MAVYQFSALSDGQAITFNATADRLNFDQTAIAAGDLTLSTEGSGVRVTVKSGAQAGKDVLLNGFSLEQIAATNFTFADGSVARVGDNTVGTVNDQNPNFLSGGAGRDLLMGLQGEDNLQGGDNNDSLVGGSGNDALSGNNGNDWLDGGQAVDTLNGGGGQDAFILNQMGSANADVLADFSTGWDSIQLDTSNAIFTQLGAAGRFTAGDARFFAGTAAHDADDRIIYNSATGQIFYDADGNGTGSTQQLIATLGTGRSVVATDFWVVGTAPGGGGNTINGTAGNDTLIGTDGNDTINGLGGNDSLDGWNGVDSVSGGDGDDTLIGGPAVNPDTGMEVSDADTLNGGLGNDLYIVHRGVVIEADSGGVDWVWAEITDWTLGAGLENLRLLATPRVESQSGTGNELDNIIDPSGLEHGGGYHGMGGNDTIFTAQRDGVYFGDDGDDVIHGEGGNGGADMFGGNGNDTLIGVAEMTGGAGADSFTFLSADVATIHDFASAVDKIHLDATNMSALGASGNFTAGDARFFAGTAAHDADDRVIFDATTGNLWYDADGNGAGEQGLIAVVTGNVVATDIFIDNGSAGGQVINGTAGNDTLTGTFEQDTINGLGGNDSIDGLEGADSLNGGDGNDTLNGWGFGSGDMAVETLNGGLGDDVYMVHDDGDIILADPGGIDTVRVLNGNWTLAADLENLDLEDSRGIAADGIGNASNNVIRSASEGGTLFGLGGNDTLIGRNAQNTVNLEGGDGNDTLIGGWHTDFDGGAGNDLLIASSTQDNLTGGSGADIFHFASPDDDFVTDFASGADKVRLDGTGFTQIGASGNFAINDARFFAGSAAHDADDRVIYDASSGTLLYDSDGSGAGEAQLISHFTPGTALVAADITVINGTAGGGGETINGTAGNDSLVGGAGNDTINGNAGNDTLRGNAGDDSLDGGSGTDLLDGGTGNDIYVVSAGDTLTDAGGIDQIYTPVSWSMGAGFENLEITGTASGVTVSGNFMSNTIIGNDAANTIRARDGNDTLTGRGGADFFDFTTAPSAGNADTITDFTSVDQLRFEDAAHAGIGATGTWGATDGRFWASTTGTAHDASDRVVYNTSTGQLYYDADGSGAGAAQLVATLQGAPTVSATDITVI
jgi:Ca2+-binding RTX toxin-like protein